MRVIKTLTFIGLLLAVLYVIYLLFQMATLAQETARCRTTPLDQLTSVDYYYCKSIGALK